MSCRILPGDSQRLARAVEWPQLVTPKEPAAEPQASAEAATRHAGEMHKLHSRVVELERALELEVRQARDKAYQEGLSAARESAAAELKPVMERMLRSCSDIAGLRARIRKEAEADLVTLTVAIARRVLRREMSVDPEAIHGVVNAALSKMQIKEVTVIRTHLDHLGVLRAYLEKSGVAAGVEIVSDASLAVGGLIIETKRGNLDASVDTQLKEIERGFTDRLGR